MRALFYYKKAKILANNCATSGPFRTVYCQVHCRIKNSSLLSSLNVHSTNQLMVFLFFSFLPERFVLEKMVAQTFCGSD